MTFGLLNSHWYYGSWLFIPISPNHCISLSSTQPAVHNHSLWDHGSWRSITPPGPHPISPSPVCLWLLRILLPSPSTLPCLACLCLLLRHPVPWIMNRRLIVTWSCPVGCTDLMAPDCGYLMEDGGMVKSIEFYPLGRISFLFPNP